jgi:glycosyltransferase involved in cell wall biosynthesis
MVAPSGSLRVLHFRSTFTFAGPERGLLTLGPPLREAGVTVKIIAYYRRRTSAPAAHPLVERGRHEMLDVEQWDDHSKFSWRTVRCLADELRRGRYDLLVTHDHKTNLIGYLAAQRSTTPRLSVAHGYDLSMRRMYLYRAVDLLVLRFYPRIVTVCDALRHELIAAGLRPGRICFVPNAIDITRFTTGAVERARLWRQRLTDTGTPVILTVARLDRQKGLKHLVRAAAEIHRVGQKAQVWIVGDGPLRARLKTQIRALGLDDVVRLLGHQSDIAALTMASDVCVMPSLGEGLSNALLEAMACAKPVVATAVGGTPELVRDGMTGWLVPPRQPELLAAAVVRILREPDLGTRIGLQARAFVEDRFDASRIAARMAAVYRQAAADQNVNDRQEPRISEPSREEVV